MNERRIQMYMPLVISLMVSISGIARADESAPSADEVEESGDGDAFATASQALGQAEKALGVAQGVKSRVVAVEAVQAGHNTRIVELERKLKELQSRGAPTADIEALKRELAAAVKADADRAETAATRAEAAKLAAEQAAARAATSAAQASTNASMGSTSAGGNSMEPADRDVKDPRGYGAAGAGASWLFRQASFTEGAVKLPENDELSSGMLPLLLEGGFAGFDKLGRMNVGLRGVGSYNVGGGSAIIGEGVFGSFVEQTHTFRLEGFAGLQWETIPTDNVSNYREWRYNVGIGAEFVFAQGHVGLLLLGRVLPANDLDDSHAGETTLVLRGKF